MNIGDRVRLLCPLVGVPQGTPGTITDIDSTIDGDVLFYTVLFDGYAQSQPVVPNCLTPAAASLQNFLILPSRGLSFADAIPQVTRDFIGALAVGEPIRNAVADNIVTASLPPGAVVLDTSQTTGVKLIQLSETDLSTLRGLQPDIRIVAEHFYFPQRDAPQIVQPIGALANAVAIGIRVRFVDKKSKQPVVGAQVSAFTDFSKLTGEGGLTDANGEVLFRRIGTQRIEQLYVYPTQGFWTLFKKNLTLTDGDVFSVQALTPNFVDAKQHFYAPSSSTDGAGVRVGVVDTGVGPHPDLIITNGGDFSVGTGPDFADVDHHGTHVAGIIASQGTGLLGIQGLAPGVSLFAYRVFSAASKGASNFSIIKAIEQAVADNCHLINMSLGGGSVDAGLQEAITFAHDNGLICFVATGNDGRQPVSFPASFSLSIAVGAMGRKKTFPASTTDQPNIKAPFGTGPADFVAAFSNIGPETDLIAPGVGILSTVPPNGYAPMSGTSMACPAATGMAARLLATQPALLAMPPAATRAIAMRQFLSSRAKSLGFGPLFEGLGQLS